MNGGRQVLDSSAKWVMFGLTLFCILLVFMIGMGLYLQARPVLQSGGLGNALFSSTWSPPDGSFGFLPFIMGTLWVTGVAALIAVPLSLLTAIYLSEYANRRVRELMRPAIDLLAGIPSVVYGVWGVLIIVPLVKEQIAPMMGTDSSGFCVLSAGIVLAVMVLPVIIHVSVEVMRAVPLELRQASLALGATKWETVKRVVLRKSLPGVVAANMLGISRAFGETMAVLMVAGGHEARAPVSVLDQAYPLPALIANNYGETMSIPQSASALMLAGLILFAIVVVFSLLSRMVLVHIGIRTQ